MRLLIILVIFALLVQIGLFFLIRYKKKMDKKNNVLDKYDIKSAKDAWNVLSDPELPEEDREKIQSIYEGRANN